MAEEEPAPKKDAGKKDEVKADAKDAKAGDAPAPVADAKPTDNKDKMSYVIDALQSGPCEDRLNMTTLQLEEDLEYFSRKFNLKDWENAAKIHANLTASGIKDLAPLQVHTWDIYDKAFHFPKVRKYDFV